jgi:hypothetical protein
VPEVEALKNLTASRLTALNHGTIKAPPGMDAARLLLGKVRNWAGRVGEIRVGDGPDPVISVQIVGVDTEAILEKARIYDNAGNRIRKVRQLLSTRWASRTAMSCSWSTPSSGEGAVGGATSSASCPRSRSRPRGTTGR